MLSFLTHVDPGTFSTTTSLPVHSRPGGQVWQLSSFGLRMYCPCTQARHSWRSSDPAFNVVINDHPIGHPVSTYLPLSLSTLQFPITCPDPPHSSVGQFLSAHE